MKKSPVIRDKLSVLKRNRSFPRPDYLLLIPLLTYFFSYIYLALYHQKAFLFNTVVHEGGTYTLLQTIFYSSHFLGHIPVYTVLALIYIGCYFQISTNPGPDSGKNLKELGFFMIFFLIIAVLISLTQFGIDDTVDFLNQTKQGVGIFQSGGAWNLHLPSTLMCFLMIPVYLFIFKWIFNQEIRFNTRGWLYNLAGIVLFVLMTLLLNKRSLQTLVEIWQNPRCLAHSVRELVTFPLVYFPIPLYFLIRKDQTVKRFKITKKLKIMIFIMAVIFIILFIYQCYLPLTHKIANLAQKPSFTRGESLPVLYLLSSHYFEHFLDSIYFTILSLILYRAAVGLPKDGKAGLKGDRPDVYPNN